MTVEFSLQPRRIDVGDVVAIGTAVLGDAEADAGAAVLATVKRAAGRHRRTGQMERRIRLTDKGTGESRRVAVHAGGKVAHLIIGGTAPHRIVARARPLPLGGRRFAESVRHPGTRPDPFVARGVEDARPGIQAALDHAGADLVRRLATEIEGGR